MLKLTNSQVEDFTKWCLNNGVMPNDDTYSDYLEDLAVDQGLALDSEFLDSLSNDC